MNFFLTGTQVYGPTTTESDIDIVMQSNESTELFAFLNANSIAPYQTEVQKKEEYGGFYFELLGLRFNILEMGCIEDFNAWKSATEGMKKVDPIWDREDRIKMFQGFLIKAIEGVK